MHGPDVSRRALLKGGGAALAGLSVLQVAGPAQAFPAHGGDDDDDRWTDDPSSAFPGDPNDQVIPWLDQPDPVPPPAADVVGKQLVWEQLNSRLTPHDNFFTVKHYGEPAGRGSRLPTGRRRTGRPSPRALARRHQGATTSRGGVHAGVLRQHRPAVLHRRHRERGRGPARDSVRCSRDARVLEDGTEVIFWGADSGPVTIRDNSG